MFETFSLRLAAGFVLALCILPGRDVHPRFFRIHWLIVLALLGAAAVFAWDGKDDWFWLPFGLAVTMSIAGFWCWAVEEFRGARGPVLALGLAAILAALIVHNGLGWQTAQDATAAGVLGMATTAMLMGHWYLIAPTMSLAPLMRLIKGMFIALGVRLLVAGVDFALAAAALDTTAWLWLASRWVAGLIGPAVLGWMAWESAKIRSTQSATGILYVVVIFVFMGELTDQLFQGHMAEIST